MMSNSRVCDWFLRMVPHSGDPVTGCSEWRQGHSRSVPFRLLCHWLLRVASASVHVNTLEYIKSHASENRQFVVSLERCCRRIDLLLDALLCECCREDKDEETDLIDLTTWVLH